MDFNGFDINPQQGAAGTYGVGICPTSINEGIDREIQVDAVCGDKADTLTLRHEGMRQPIALSGGGVFRIKNGGRFGVLKVGGVTPDEPVVETYTRLTYIEATGVQHIEIDYQLTEDDTIDVLYEPTLIDKSDQFVFGAPNTWWSTYNQSGYARFGDTSSVSVSSGTYNYRVQLSKEKLVLNEITTTTLAYTGLTDGKIGIFSGMGAAGSAYNRGNFRIMWFRIKGVDGNDTIDLAPAKRDNDGKVGMLDLVSGTFYTNMDDGDDFIGGNEVRVTEDYEIIDRVYFNKNKAFNTGYLGNNTTYIDVMFQRTSTSAAAYLFGLTQGNRFTGYLAANSAYWRYGNAYPTFSLGTQKIYKAVVTPGKTTIDATSKTFTVNEFETSDPIPVGGYKSGTNAVTKHYIGYIYYFRMRHGDTLLVDWYPCKRKSDGVEGFWDCVTQTFVESL